jgi:DNA-binding IclR family transcriptional regulator
LSLLEVFSREQRELSNSELARHLGLPESSCSDLVHTLLNAGYLMRTLNSRRLYPTARLLRLGQKISANDPLFAVAQEACDLLRDATDESAMCGRIESGFVRVLAECDGRHQLRYASFPGEKLALHVSAIGRMILANLPAEEATRQLSLKPLRQLTPQTITDLDALRVQIRKAGKQGWCLVENEGGEDIAAIAVAVRISDDWIGLALTGPVSRLKARRKAYLQALCDIRDQFGT